MREQNDKYMKVIECMGELLLQKDETIKFNKYEIDALKKKIETIEEYITFYQPTEKETE